MAAPSTSSGEPALPRRSLRSALLWGGLALSPLCLVGLVAAWQNAAPQRTLPPASRPPVRALAAVDMSVPQAASAAEPAPMTRETSEPSAPPDDMPESVASAAVPQAGRQVMRCIEHGRVTYRDLQATCPEGVGQAVTVFPTRGVEKFKAGP